MLLEELAITNSETPNRLMLKHFKRITGFLDVSMADLIYIED